MEGDVWTIRAFDASDLPSVEAWWSARHQAAFPVAILPPVGLVAELNEKPVAACWLYMAVGVGVAWLEHAISAPRLSMRNARAAFKLLVQGMQEIAKTHDYGVLMAHTLPGIARVMRSFGFKQDTRPKITTIKTLWQ